MLYKCYFLCPLCLCVEICFWTAEYKLCIYRNIYVGKINNKNTTIKQTKQKQTKQNKKKGGGGGGGDQSKTVKSENNLNGTYINLGMNYDSVFDLLWNAQFIISCWIEK